MPVIGHDYLKAAVAATEAPCVSVYLPTHRSHPENAQDPIRFKNLIAEIEESLNRSYAVREVRAILEPFARLQADAEFWNHTLDGMAVLASPTRFDVFTAPRAVRERAVVADSFYIKPLVRYLQSADRFHLLALAEDKFALFEGTRYALDPIPSPKVSWVARPPASTNPPVENVVGEGLPGYFREVDRAVTEDVSKPAGIPLVLAGLTTNLSQFRSVSKNPHLVAEGVSGDPYPLDADKLRNQAWAVLERHYLERLAKLREDFGLAVSREQGTSDLSDAARAAVAGRIATLLLDSDQILPGVIDPATGEIRSAEQADPHVDDMLDDLAELVLKTGGEVVAVPGDRMPSTTGLAAIFRY